MASFSIRKTSLAFVSAHLEAHEGHSHYVNRCSSLANILSGAKVGPTPQRYDASLSNHYCFVLGDLNFRTCFETEVLADSEEKHEHCVTRAKAMIEERDWKGLHKADELSKAIREKRCLVGFRTEVCQFPATFKMKKKQGHVYDERRTPR